MNSGIFDGTFEAVGPHFQGNPENYDEDMLLRHGADIISEEELGDRDYYDIMKYLYAHNVEGIVFWKDGEPGCKIKRSDFNYSWPVKEEYMPPWRSLGKEE